MKSRRPPSGGRRDVSVRAEPHLAPPLWGPGGGRQAPAHMPTVLPRLADKGSARGGTEEYEDEGFYSRSSLALLRDSSRKQLQRAELSVSDDSDQDSAGLVVSGRGWLVDNTPPKPSRPSSGATSLYPTPIKVAQESAAHGHVPHAPPRKSTGHSELVQSLLNQIPRGGPVQSGPKPTTVFSGGRVPSNPAPVDSRAWVLQSYNAAEPAPVIPPSDTVEEEIHVKRGMSSSSMKSASSPKAAAKPLVRRESGTAAVVPDEEDEFGTNWSRNPMDAEMTDTKSVAEVMDTEHWGDTQGEEVHIRPSLNFGDADTDADGRPMLNVAEGFGDTMGSHMAASMQGSWDMSVNGTLKLDGFGIITKAGIKEARFTKGEAAVARAPPNVRDELIMLEEIGRGASGIVRRALHIPTLQLVAVKHVRIFDAEKRHQMIRELRALYTNMVPLTPGADRSVEPEAIPWLVQFYDAYTTAQAGIVSIVLEYMSRGSLQDAVNRGGIQDEAALCRISWHTMMGLAYLEEHHQLHRDIKPANMLLSHAGEVKLADFGISRELSETTAKANTFVGTLIYMAPERIDSEGYSYQSDVWSAGLSILSVVLGRFPYETNGGYWLLSKAIRDDPAPAVPDTYSPEFRDFIAQCLIKDPHARPTASALLKHPFLAQYAGALGDASMASSTASLSESFGEMSTEDQASRALDDLVQSAVAGEPFRMLCKYFGRRPRRRNVRMSAEELSKIDQAVISDADVMETHLGLGDVRKLAAQLGIPPVKVRAVFNRAIAAANHK